MQMLRAEVTIVGANIGVNTESTKMLFVNTYDWVKRDSIFKQVMYQKEHPGETPIMESVIINLGPM
ncbi:MAG: hypothetical protein JST59_00935 [Actinobacteria bacterium]|nr:hypothetical protein [Actinomycetota bacterium]